MLEIWIGGIGAFFLGACFGSLANVLAHRLFEASTLMGRSRCPECRVAIKPQHLVPIYSWFALHGRCASCGKRIHIQYPMVEAAMALLFLTAFLRHPEIMAGQNVPAFIFETIFSFVLVNLVVFDLRWKLLPVELMAGCVIFFAAWNLWRGMSASDLLLGMGFGASFLFIQVLISRGRWMGSGDPWLGGLIGAALGWPFVGISFYLTYLLGGFLGIFLLTSGLAKRGARIAFAPLLSAGALLTVWFGAGIESYFIRLFV